MMFRQTPSITQTKSFQTAFKNHFTEAYKERVGVPAFSFTQFLPAE
jgi:hypothetical protein